jgi:hypothetical protein
VDKDQSDSPPSLINGSSVDADSSTSGGRTDREEEQGEQQSTITVAAAGSGCPLLTISQSKLRASLISSMSSVAAVATPSQLKLPMTRSSLRKQTSNVDSSKVTPAILSNQETAAPPEEEASKLPNSPLSMQLSSDPLVADDSKENDEVVVATSQPSTECAVEQLPQPQSQQKPLVESSTCTEEEDNEDDVIEIESEVDTPVGGGEGEKETSISADTLSSDDEWDESLLPPK